MSDDAYEQTYQDALRVLRLSGVNVGKTFSKNGGRLCRINGLERDDFHAFFVAWGRERAERIRKARRQLVELHESPAAQGAKLDVTVSVRVVAQPPRNAATTLPDMETKLEGVRVLVVDDEADVREFLAAALRQYGAEVETAPSVASALEAIELARPHIVFSDIAMPGEDGYALIRAIKSLERERGVTIPAVAVTGRRGPGEHTEALKSGFHWYIGKPVEPAELATIVADVLGQRPEIHPVGGYRGRIAQGENEEAARHFASFQTRGVALQVPSK